MGNIEVGPVGGRAKRRASWFFVLVSWLVACAPLPAQTRPEPVDPQDPRGRFGEVVEDALVIESALDALVRKERSPEARRNWEAAIERIARVSQRDRGPVERKQLAAAWKRIAELMLRLDGPSVEYHDSLEIAYGLDPDDELLRKEVEYQRTRRSVAESRVAEAARVRAEQAAGRDPYRDLPYIGGKGRQPIAPGRN
ncbi:hypothetical protein ASA1KI_08860 [Opitutales bacterium ASA1]|jgi:hypothetical protein|uniref:hypothetical protein n=1 Tax=Congregicoccus parvus TaxID=3081749 RepID=UPI002B29797D|nr:hypothetical protein ASA1KI_08860 [Opitutales bacterium ASA1]